MTKDEYVKLFRGAYKQGWAEQLEQHGWPHHAAVAMSEFLVGERREPPSWESISGTPQRPITQRIERSALREWRAAYNEEGRMTSAIWEYCPREFVDLLDALEAAYGEIDGASSRTRTGTP